MCRTKLQPTSGFKTIYNNLDVSCFNNKGQRGNFVTPDMAEGLKKLKYSVESLGGQLLIIDLFRDWSVQAENRRKYETGEKAAFVAKPGGSFHTAGRAVDISVKNLNFPNIDKDDWLQKFWDIAIPIGFRPIIRIPDLHASESWHFDFAGKDWMKAYDLVSYPEVAKCAILDVGEWNPAEDKAKVDRMFLQAQLVRLGYFQIGKVDGLIGPKTKTVLDMLGNPSAKDLASKS